MLCLSSYDVWQVGRLRERVRELEAAAVDEAGGAGPSTGRRVGGGAGGRAGVGAAGGGGMSAAREAELLSAVANLKVACVRACRALSSSALRLAVPIL